MCASLQIILEMKGFLFCCQLIFLSYQLLNISHVTSVSFMKLGVDVMQRYSKSSYICLFFQPKHKQGSIQWNNERIRQGSRSTFLINMTGELES